MKNFTVVEFITLVCFALILAIFIFCAWCFGYNVDAMFGVNLPWYVDAIGGVLLNGINVTIAFVIWVLKLCNVSFPLFV